MYDTQLPMQAQLGAVQTQPTPTLSAELPPQVAPEQTPQSVVDVYVYPKDFQMVNDDRDNDCILVDIHFCVNAYEKCGDGQGANRSGTIKKRLMLSRTQLLNDLMTQDATTPVIVVEETTIAPAAAPTSVAETKTASDVTKRMRELAGIPTKGNWV